MTDHLNNPFYLHDNKNMRNEINTAKNFYDWATTHTELCYLYTGIIENNSHVRNELKAQLEESFLCGKLLLDVLEQSWPLNKKPLIPPSGMNRFNQPKEALGTKEVFSRNPNHSYRAETGTSNYSKTSPMPSRTYLQKKAQVS
jgi:hypothetical protein